MKKLTLGFCALALACWLPSEPASADGGFVIVVNQGNDVTSMSRSDLKRAITGGTKQWGSGAAVQVGIIASEAPETQYLASLLDTSARELLAKMQEQVFKGELRRPVVLRGPGDCAAFAKASAGGICACAASVPLPAEVHVVAIR